MKVTGDASLRPAVTTLVIELDDMEAGFLRAVLRDYVAEHSEGFAARLFGELTKFTFPAHEHSFPNALRSIVL